MKIEKQPNSTQASKLQMLATLDLTSDLLPAMTSTHSLLLQNFKGTNLTQSSNITILIKN